MNRGKIYVIIEISWNKKYLTILIKLRHENSQICWSILCLKLPFITSITIRAILSIESQIVVRFPRIELLNLSVTAENINVIIISTCGLVISDYQTINSPISFYIRRFYIRWSRKRSSKSVGVLSILLIHWLLNFVFYLKFAHLNLTNRTEQSIILEIILVLCKINQESNFKDQSNSWLSMLKFHPLGNKMSERKIVLHFFLFFRVE